MNIRWKVTTLRLEAELLAQGGTEQLHLTCSDDGVGIVAALGGRVWATSAGIGHGASMHLQLPVETETASDARAA